MSESFWNTPEHGEVFREATIAVSSHPAVIRRDKYVLAQLTSYIIACKWNKSCGFGCICATCGDGCIYEHFAEEEFVLFAMVILQVEICCALRSFGFPDADTTSHELGPIPVRQCNLPSRVGSLNRLSAARSVSAWRQKIIFRFLWKKEANGTACACSQSAVRVIASQAFFESRQSKQKEFQEGESGRNHAFAGVSRTFLLCRLFRLHVKATKPLDSFLGKQAFWQKAEKD